MMTDKTKEVQTRKYVTDADKVTEEVQTIRYTQKKFLELFREIFDADACHLYLLSTEMDDSEKKDIISETIAYIESEIPINIDRPQGESEIKYEEINTLFVDTKDKLDNLQPVNAGILKFIDVEEKDGPNRWNYDYKNRPAKYVIFNKYTNVKKTILKEGLTAYIARSGETLIFNNAASISSFKSSASLNFKKKIAPQSEMMIGFPLTNKNGKNIGVLKIENYTKGEYSYDDHDIRVQEAREYLPLLVRFIESSRSHFSANSYTELFRGMDLLKDLIRIRPIILKDLLILYIKSLKGYFLSNSFEELSIVKESLSEIKKIDVKTFEAMERIEPNLSKHMSRPIELNSFECLKRIKCPKENSQEISDILENLKKFESYEWIHKNLHTQLNTLKLKEINEEIINQLLKNLYNKQLKNIDKIKNDLSKIPDSIKNNVELNNNILNLLGNLDELKELFKNSYHIKSYGAVNSKIKYVVDELEYSNQLLTNFVDCLDKDQKELKFKHKYADLKPQFLEIRNNVKFNIKILIKIFKISMKKANNSDYNQEIYNFLIKCKNEEIYSLIVNLKKIKPESLDKLHCTKPRADKITNICDNESLQKLKRISRPEEINKDMFNATLHLFLVLKRSEYIGYDEILNRVSEYANEMNDVLDLKEDMTRSFKEYLEEVRTHEELLLCGLNDYRDHFMHMFHVFIGGYIIINELGIEMFRKKIAHSMKYILKTEKMKIELSKSDVLRIWFLAAFYHDYAYILEKIDTELESFFEAVLGYPFTVKFNWEQLLQKKSEFPKYLNYLVNFFAAEKETNQGTLLRNYLDSIIGIHEHGVLSALLLIFYNSKATQKRFNECLYAALAISLHNTPVYENLTEENKRRISFESFPIAFLLAYCDTAQSFGRLEGKAHVESSKYPVKFSGISVNRNKNSLTKKPTLEKEKTTIIYKLEYICDQLHKIPTGEALENWAKDVHNVFNSEEYNFEIDYLKTNGKRIHKLSFH